jgi:hypothetical protein
MRMRWSTYRCISIGGALLLSACSDSMVGPPADVSKVSNPSFVVADACQTITFNDFSHGNLVTSVALSGMTINFAAGSFLQPSGSPNPRNNLRAFNTNVDPTKGDGVWEPGDWEDLDLTWKTPGVCEDCNGLGRVLVIEDNRGFNPFGDYRWGGTVTLTGFAPNSYIDQFTVVDNNAGEPPFTLRIDGTQVAASTPHGEAEVEVVTPSSRPTITSSAVFQFSGTPEVDRVTGSGALDNIKVCTRREELGEEGCTPGFWKNHLDQWASTGLSPSQTVEDIFDVPDAFGLDGMTLLAALSAPGGPTLAETARVLLHHAVAALLNASHPGVDYPRTPESIIADVNAALASGSRSTMLSLKNMLDADNNLGCPLN